MDDVLKNIARALERMEETENLLHNARLHIRRNLHRLPPKELECLAMDSVIEYTEIPENLRTTFVRDLRTIQEMGN